MQDNTAQCVLEEFGSPFQDTVILYSRHALDRLGHHLKTNPHYPGKVLRSLMRNQSIRMIDVPSESPRTERWRAGCFVFVVIRRRGHFLGMEFVKVKTCWRVVEKKSRVRDRDGRAKNKRGWRKEIEEF